MSTGLDYILLGITTVLLFSTRAYSTSVAIAKEAERYLLHYGYLRGFNANNGFFDEDAWIGSVKNFQSFAGLNTTGELNEETVEAMSRPRCGISDNMGSKRAKRFATHGSIWPRKQLTYKIFKYPKRLRRVDVEAIIAKAFALWTEHINLDITAKKSAPVDIAIKFLEGEHCDGEPFDGNGGTLAHANFPLRGGEVHFDDADAWSTTSSRGISLLQTAVHEFGHVLGLLHSKVNGSTMTPYYDFNKKQIVLHPDDVAGIQDIYGPRRRGKENPLCRDPQIDTIFNSHDNQTYIFKGDKYYKLNGTSVADGYPKLISEGWPGLPENIDAAVEDSQGKTYFFKGPRYWVYVGHKLQNGFPERLKVRFPRIPAHLDAVMFRHDENKTYFFKDDSYWILDNRSLQFSDRKSISDLGLPGQIDAAFQYSNGYSYFFKGEKYYRLDATKKYVESGYPRPTSASWLGC